MKETIYLFSGILAVYDDPIMEYHKITSLFYWFDENSVAL